MKYIDSEEMKLIQMDILDALQRFCMENGLTYSLSSGSLIGAVRHRGYIPWDDDIDVYMLRADYNRLMEKFPEVYDGRFAIGSLERNPKWDRTFAKMYDNRTVLVENRRDAVETGINIDIFPIDEVPADDTIWLRYNKRRYFFCHLFEVKDRLVRDNTRSWWKTVVLLPLKALLLPWSKRTMAERISAFAQKWNGCNSGRVYNCAWGEVFDPFSKSLFDEIIDIPFEDRTFKCFAGYDEYLRATYGDYMKLPPEDRRVSHHKFKAWYK